MTSSIPIRAASAPGTSNCPRCPTPQSGRRWLYSPSQRPAQARDSTTQTVQADCSFPPFH